MLVFLHVMQLRTGGKSSKLLYWLATWGLASRVIPVGRDPRGQLCTSLGDIAAVFACYYESLYAAGLRSPEDVRTTSLCLSYLDRQLTTWTQPLLRRW